MATMKDPGVVKRVTQEKEELDAKLKKLKAFIASPDYSLLGNAVHGATEEQRLLLRQQMLMEHYSMVLGERLKLFAAQI